MCFVCEASDPRAVANRKWCQPCQIKVHRIANKMRAVKMLGGRCSTCGWSGDPVSELAIFDFHHRGDKDFNLSPSFNKKWESIVQEIKKCVLLCASCHRLENSKRDAKLMAAALERFKLMEGMPRLDS